MTTHLPKKNTLAPSLKLPRGIRVRGNAFQVSVYRNGVRRTAAADTLVDALALHRQFTSELEAAVAAAVAAVAGADAPVSNASASRSSNAWTLETAFERTIALVWADKACEQAQTLNARDALRFFGSTTKLDAITLERIDAYVSHLQGRGNSGSTVNRKLSALSSMLRVAHERGKIEHLPKMPRRKEGEHRIRFLSIEEEARLLHHVRQVLGYTDHADAIEVLIYTGFRCGELWRLEARDVDLERGTLTLWRTKNGRPRTIPIVARIRPIIERHIEGGDGGRLFPAGSNDWLRRVWDKARLDLGYAEDSQFVPHMLRHTCATRLAQRGISMPIIKEWMGHTTIQTTARYAHFSPTDLQNAALLLGGGEGAMLIV